MWGSWKEVRPQGLTLKKPEKLQLYGLYVHYVVHICDFGMLRVNWIYMKWQFMMANYELLDSLNNNAMFESQIYNFS